MSSIVILYIISLQSVLGTFFPPVSNPPPISAQVVRALENSPGFYTGKNVPQDLPTPRIKQGLFPPEDNTENQRWSFQENQSDEIVQDKNSTETLDSYYPSGEPAIGPVATPIPDAFTNPLGSISNLNPNDPTSQNAWSLARGYDNQNLPGRWIQVQVPANKLYEVVNQDGIPSNAAGAVKSVEALSPPEVPVKTQFTANTLANIIQEIWIRSPRKVGSVVNKNPVEIIDEVPTAKRIVDIPTADVKQVVQQQIIENASSDPLSPPVIASSPPIPKKTFTAPSPLPPPLKGFDPASKIATSGNDIALSNAVGGTGSFQRVRHMWVPTSSRTGKFISFPVPGSIHSGKSVANVGFPQDSAPIVASDTWMLKQEGSIPSFEQQKSVQSAAEIQNGELVFQSHPATELSVAKNPLVIDQIDSSKNPPIIGKSVDQNTPVDIWPGQKDNTNSKFIDTSLGDILPTLPKSDGITTALTGEKSVENSKNSILPAIYSPPVNILPRKPCPIPPLQLQKYLFSPRNSAIIAVPRIIDNQRRPLVSIMHVNRHPLRSYFLLSNGIRPSYLAFPSAALLQQSETQILRLTQTNQIPIQYQTKQPVSPLQSTQFSNRLPSERVAFPFSIKEIVLPVSPTKSSGIVYPSLQAIRYTYPWDRNSNYNSVPTENTYNPLKAEQPIPNSNISKISHERSISEPEQKNRKKKEMSEAEKSGSFVGREKESSAKETEKEIIPEFKAEAA